VRFPWILGGIIADKHKKYYFCPHKYHPNKVIMKKGLIYFFFLAISGFYSCSDNIENRIEGQWQLKTIEENGVISQVDTVFYCFMGGRVFSYTLSKKV
jgi:hypothetical protein